MEKQDFKEFLEILADDESIPMEPQDGNVFWKHFNKIARDIKSHPYTIDDLAQMTHYSEKQKVVFRDAMAREGVEFTPNQARLYLLTLDIALSMNGTV